MDYEERVLNGKDVFKSFLMVRISEAGQREGGRVFGGAFIETYRYIWLGTLKW